MHKEGGGERGLWSCLCMGQRVRETWNKGFGTFWPWRFVGGRTPVLLGALLNSVCLSSDPQKGSAPWKSWHFPSLPPVFPSGCELVPLGHAQVTSWAGVGGSAWLGRPSAHHKLCLTWEWQSCLLWEQSAERLPSEGTAAGHINELERQPEVLGAVGWRGRRMWWQMRDREKQSRQDC